VVNEGPQTGYLFYHLMQEFASQTALPALRWGDVQDGDHVSVQIRKNPYKPGWDSVIPAWVEFFRRTDDRFVVIGEVDELPDLPNVEKRRGPVDKDLEVILGARFHMGTVSGPCAVAWFNPKPYCLFNSNMGPGFCAGYHNGRFTWSKKRQSLLIEQETIESIQREYEALC
jgi:hypothetical protein